MLETVVMLGGAGLAVGFIMWYLVYTAKARGVAEQVARDQAVVLDAETQIHEVQAEERDTEETKRRLKRGDF